MVCTKCKQDKSLAEFAPRKRGGHYTQCRACTNAWHAARRRLPEFKARAYKRTKAWKLSHPGISAIHQKVGHAIKTGKLSKPTTCSYCLKESRIEGHHQDYSKPLDVVWLCSSCHRFAHLPN